MFDSREYEYESSESLKKHFNKYCNWCWYHGFGDCKICERLKNQVLLELKLKEFKSKKKDDN